MKSSFLWLRPVERALTIGVQTVAVLSAVVMISSLIVGVFFRYVMQDSLTWSEEVAMLCFSWLIFLTAALMVRENGHVRVELIESIISPQFYGMLNRLIWVMIAMIGIYMVWTGFQFISLTMGQSSPAIRYPIWMRSLSFPVGGILITIYALLNLEWNSGIPADAKTQPIAEQGS